MADDQTTIAVVREVLRDWSDVNITKHPAFWLISGVYEGRFHAAVPIDAVDGARRLDAIAKDGGRTENISVELMALLVDGEAVDAGKKRLLAEYDSLTQKLLDDRYEMGATESDRHESISAVLLELRR
jgi:hypothetical protein